MRTQINIRHNIQRIYISNTYPKGSHDNTGTLISNTTNDDGGIGSNSKVTFTTNTSNTYYISAGAYSNNTGTYTLTATATGSNANITPNPSDNYLYDANGNMTQNNHKLIQWTSFNKPKHFTNSNSNDTTAFAYAPNRNRYHSKHTLHPRQNPLPPLRQPRLHRHHHRRPRQHRRTHGIHRLRTKTPRRLACQRPTTPHHPNPNQQRLHWTRAH